MSDGAAQLREPSAALACLLNSATSPVFTRHFFRHRCEISPIAAAWPINRRHSESTKSGVKRPWPGESCSDSGAMGGDFFVQIHVHENTTSRGFSPTHFLPKRKWSCELTALPHCAPALLFRSLFPSADGTWGGAGLPLVPTGWFQSAHRQRRFSPWLPS